MNELSLFGNLELKQNPLTKDLIIGSIMNYRPEDVACWINSIRDVNFTGDVFVVNYGCPKETIEYLQRQGVVVYDAELNELHIVVQRFYTMFTILHTLNLCDYRCVFATDVKDVIFQKNPSLRFKDNNRYARLLASTENIQYENEDWGRNNLKTCFPHLYEFMRWQIIYNAGTIAGEFELVRDLFLHIFHLSLVGIQGDPQPDQAAYNILINTRPFINNVYFCDDDDAWVANLGTTLDPTKKNKYAPYWMDPAPNVVDGKVYNNKGLEYTIVHQYDRVPDLKPIIQNKFGSLR
jgi:hypothetical protein